MGKTPENLQSDDKTFARLTERWEMGFKWKIRYFTSKNNVCFASLLVHTNKSISQNPIMTTTTTSIRTRTLLPLLFIAGWSLISVAANNPFAKGCLAVLSMKDERFAEGSNGSKFGGTRVCNSDDAYSGNDNCNKSVFAYKEVRISPGEWESSRLVS